MPRYTYSPSSVFSRFGAIDTVDSPHPGQLIVGAPMIAYISTDGQISCEDNVSTRELPLSQLAPSALLCSLLEARAF